MTCPACERNVSKRLMKIPDVKKAGVNYSNGIAEIEAGRFIDDDEIEEALSDSGYTTKKTAKISDKIPYLIIICTIALFLILNGLGAMRIFNYFPEAEEGASYVTLFLIGLLTSFHCIAMCGGINLGQSTAAVKNGRAPLRSNIEYQAGRVISYSLIGGFIGLLGSVISINSAVKGGIMIAAGIFMVIISFNILGIFDFLKKFQPRLPKKLTAKISRFGRGKGSFVTGLLNGFMPCGPLQSMQIFALSTGSFISGFLSMFCFSIGTVPLLFLFGFFGGKLNKKFSGWMMRISAAVILLLSLSMLANGLSLAGVNITGTDTESSVLAEGSDDVQEVTSTMTYTSYEAITVEKGTTVEWTLVVPEGSLVGCNNRISIPEYDLEITLEEGENIITFFPEESGTYTFTCWMGMIRSTITVVDEL